MLYSVRLFNKIRVFLTNHGLFYVLKLVNKGLITQIKNYVIKIN